MSQREALDAGAQALGLDLTELQSDRLLAYAALILKWSKVYNLTAVREPHGVLTHHLLDSLAVIAPLQRQWPVTSKRTRLLDVGSGAGLPGVVIAILREDIEVSCLDAIAKKAAFVQQVAAELQVPNLRGVHARVESLVDRYELISARAFASLGDFFVGSAALLVPGGVWLAMKGKTPKDELAALPPGVEVFHVEQLSVPGLDAERCVVWARRAPA